MRNWKTTACGLVIALALAVQNYTGANTWQGWVGVLGAAALGFFSKDMNVTGGKVQQ